MKRLIKFRNKGFSLVSVMVAVGISGILMVVVAQIIQQAMMSQAYLQQRFGSFNMKYSALNLLADRTTCEVNFANTNPKTNSPSETQILLKDGVTVLFAENGVYENGSIRVTSIGFENFFPYALTGPDRYRGTVDLAITMEGSSKSIGPKSFRQSIRLIVQLKGFTPVAGPPDEIETCTAIGSNIDSIWTLKTSGDIYFNGNNVGIGTVTPTQKLHVEGMIQSAAFLYPSDENLKKNIDLIEDSVSILEQLNGVYFDWRKTGKRDIGVIAQQVEKALPEAVQTNKITGEKSVDYSRIIPVLIESNKFLLRENRKFKKDIEALKDYIRRYQTNN